MNPKEGGGCGPDPLDHLHRVFSELERLAQVFGIRTKLVLLDYPEVSECVFEPRDESE